LIRLFRDLSNRNDGRDADTIATAGVVNSPFGLDRLLEVRSAVSRFVGLTGGPRAGH